MEVRKNSASCCSICGTPTASGRLCPECEKEVTECEVFLLPRGQKGRAAKQAGWKRW